MIYMTSKEIAKSLRDRINYQKTQRDLAKDLGVSESYLSDFLSGNRGAGPTILKALGFSLTQFYKKAKP